MNLSKPQAGKKLLPIPLFLLLHLLLLECLIDVVSRLFIFISQYNSKLFKILLSQGETSD